MKTFFKILLLLVLATAVRSSAQSPIVQSNACSATTCAFSSNNTAGNAIFIQIMQFGAFSPAMQSASDSQGNTYYCSAGGAYTIGYQSSHYLAMTYCLANNIKAGANTISVAVNVSTTIVELSGLDSFGTPIEFLPASIPGAFNAGGTQASNSVTTYNNNDLLIGFTAAEYTNGGGSLNTPSGYTWINGVNSSAAGQNIWGTYYQDGVSAGTYTFTSTYGGGSTRNYASGLLALRRAYTYSAPFVHIKNITGTSLSYTPAAGHTLIAWLANQNNSVGTITADSAGNTWTQIGTSSANFASARVYYAANVSGSADTITLSAAPSGGTTIIEIVAPAVSPLDTNTAWTANTEATGSLTTTGTDNLLTFYMGEYGLDGANDPGSGWKNMVFANVGKLLLQYQTNVAAGTYSDTVTNGSGYLRNRSIGMAAFKYYVPAVSTYKPTDTVMIQ